MLFAIYKKLRLFWFAFMLALGLLMGIAIRTGDVNPADLQAKIMEYSFEYVRKNPQALERALEMYASVFEAGPGPGTSGGLATSRPKPGASSGSLSALKERQRLEQTLQVAPLY